MVILDSVIIVFVLLELANVIVLYKAPELKVGNGLGVFKVIDALKKQEDAYLFVKYLINWIANAKLIFIALLLVIVVFADETVKFYSLVVLILTVFMYYVTLHPIIKLLDAKDQLSPKGYAKKLLYMIMFIQVMFVIALGVYWILN